MNHMINSGMRLPFNNQILKSILGDDAIDIQHIGSTAIPAIKAKPIIDIVVGVTDFDKVMLHNEQLRQVGIFYRGSDVECQLLYVMGDMEMIQERTIFIL